MPPRLSVVLPVRDSEATIGAAVDSVLRQSFEDFELIAVDDASKDGTRAVLDAAAKRDPRVQVLSGPGTGVVGAANLGLSACRGEFVARMDGDDESLPERFALQLAALEAEPGLAGVGSAVELFRDDRPVSPNMQLYGAWLSSLTTREALFRDRFVESPLCQPSVTMRRNVITEGYRDGRFPEDYEFWLRLLCAGHAFRALPEVLFRWRDHERRLTRTDERYDERGHRELKASYLAHTVLQKERRCVIWGAGKTGLPLMRVLRERGIETVCFVEVDVRKVGTRIEGVPIFGVEEFPRWHQAHVLAAVGAKGGRQLIREFFAARGVVEGPDFTCVA